MNTEDRHHTIVVPLFIMEIEGLELGIAVLSWDPSSRDSAPMAKDGRQFFKRYVGVMIIEGAFVGCHEVEQQLAAISNEREAAELVEHDHVGRAGWPSESASPIRGSSLSPRDNFQFISSALYAPTS